MTIKSGITCTYKNQNSIKVQLKKPPKRKKELFHDGNFIVCSAKSIYKANPNISNIFMEISQNKLPQGIRNREELEMLYNPLPDKIGCLPLRYFPKNFEDYIRSIRSELSDYIQRTFNIYRWRTGQPGVHNPFSRGGMVFSLDNKKWFLVPHGIKGAFSIWVPPILPDKIGLKIRQLVESNHDQPKGHLLFCEANSIRGSNPRNALLIAMSALEVAVKECIIKLNPDSQWVVKNMPSPNILQLINEYIPKISKNAKSILPLPKMMKEIVLKGVVIRNKIAHIGEQAPKNETQKEIFATIGDLLWILDYCAGHDWALNFISKETRRLIFETQE